eukprot:COSAG04_NODE_4801_length_1887_cov_21.250559_2_plen_194_part_00
MGPAMVGWMKRRPKPVVRVVGWISTRNSGLLPIPLPAQAAASAPRHPDDSSCGSRQTEADGDSPSLDSPDCTGRSKGGLSAHEVPGKVGGLAVVGLVPRAAAELLALHQQQHRQLQRPEAPAPPLVVRLRRICTAATAAVSTSRSQRQERRGLPTHSCAPAPARPPQTSATSLPNRSSPTGFGNCALRRHGGP